MTKTDDDLALVVATGDWHVNDTQGLCPPIFHREALGQYRPGPAVRGLERDWKRFWAFIADKKQETGATVYSHCVGDLADLNTHSQTQLISPLDTDILRAMVDIAQPMLDVSDYIFVERGTEAHVGGNGKLEEMFADDIGAIPDRDNGHASWWVFTGEHGGVTFDITHHPPTGTRRVELASQAAARAAGITAARYNSLRRTPPQVAIWGHIHIGAKGGPEMGVLGFLLPPFKLVGAFGHRLGAGAHVEPVGGLWLLCQGGKILDGDLLKFVLPAPRRWHNGVAVSNNS